MSDTAMMARVGTGAEALTAGAYNSLRQNTIGQLATSSPLYDAVMRGNCFSVANQAGVTSQAGLSATTPVLTLANPVNSGVNAVIHYVGATYLVAFAAAAAVFVALGDYSATAVTGTLTTTHRNLKAGTSQGCKIKTFLAATLPAAPVAIDLLGCGLTGAITTVPAIQTLERWYYGAIVLTPGTNLSVQTSTASGASGQLNTFIWEEVPA